MVGGGIISGLLASSFGSLHGVLAQCSSQWDTVFGASFKCHGSDTADGSWLAMGCYLCQVQESFGHYFNSWYVEQSCISRELVGIVEIIIDNFYATETR